MSISRFDTESKRKQVKGMSSEALRRINDTANGPELPDSNLPLAGLVHITGIGAVPLTVIRAELNERSRA